MVTKFVTKRPSTFKKALSREQISVLLRAGMAAPLAGNIMPLGMVAVGHPAETPKPKNKWHEEFVL